MNIDVELRKPIYKTNRRTLDEKREACILKTLSYRILCTIYMLTTVSCTKFKPSMNIGESRDSYRITLSFIGIG